MFIKHRTALFDGRKPLTHNNNNNNEKNANLLLEMQMNLAIVKLKKEINETLRNHVQNQFQDDSFLFFVNEFNCS